MRTYKVGGAVRDQLLAYPHQEIDWVVVGSTPQAMLEAGFTQVGKDFPVFLHPKTREEYALARTERKSGRGYHGFQVHADPAVTLEEDLQRRDLTINAMAMTEAGEIIDPYGGRADLAARQLRHVSAHFVEDPLRVLRVARFAARYQQLGFGIAPETMQLMIQIVDEGELEHLSPERVWIETERALGEANPETYFEVLQACGALQRMLPALMVTHGITRLTKAKTATANPTVRWAALLSDLPANRAGQACDQLKTPKTYKELATKVCEWRTQLKSALRDAPHCMKLLQGLDALRREEPFGGFCETAAALEGTEKAANPAIELLQAARASAIAVKAADLAASGLTGIELGQAISAQRINAIAKVIDSAQLALH